MAMRGGGGPRRAGEAESSGRSSRSVACLFGANHLKAGLRRSIRYYRTLANTTVHTAHSQAKPSKAKRKPSQYKPSEDKTRQATLTAIS